MLTCIHQFLQRVFLLSIIISAPLFGQILQYDEMVVEQIEIEVMNMPSGSIYDTGAVCNRIVTKEGNLFSHIDFDSDLKILAIEFDRIEPCVETVDDGIFIKLKVWLKPTIRTVTWAGNFCYKCDKLEKESGICAGSIFDRLEFNKCFHKLKGFYVKNGYFEAELDYDIQQDCVSNNVDIVITITEGRCGKIKDICFHNFTECEEEEIMDLILTKKYNIFTSWLSHEGIYNEEVMLHDQFQMVNFLQNEGYADVKVDFEIDDATCANRIIVHIFADKGERYYFGPVTFKGNCIFSDEQIWNQFEFEEGDAFSPDDLRQTAANISELYGCHGYIDAIVDYEPKLEGDCPIYSVHFEIDEGEQYRVGLIKVLGNCSTQTNVILHECLLIPGEVFNTVKLKKTEEKLRNIGYFSTVNVYAVRGDDESCLGENYRDVHIEVDETSTGKFSAFFGFSNVENFFGGATISENNFNWRGLSRVWDEGYQALRGGGEYAYISTSIGAKSRKYSLSWTKPWFMDTPWVVGFDLDQTNIRYISSDYDINSWGINLHAEYRLNAFWRFGWHYRLRNAVVHVENDEEVNSAQLDKEAHNKALVSASGISFVFDSTDHPQRPREGFRSRILFEYAGLGGDATFFSTAYINTLYVPVTKKGCLKFRGDLKFLFPVFSSNYANMPIDERLFLGGDDTVRGFRPYALGPKFQNTNDPRGGLSMNLLSAEYVHKFFKRLDGFVFMDAGNLSKKEWDVGHLKASAGFGVRFSIFAGTPPVTVGMGFPFNPRHKSDVKRFFFSLGGNF